MSKCLRKLDLCQRSVGLFRRTHVVSFLVQKHEAPGFGESYTEDLPTFSLSPQEYITNVRVDAHMSYISFILPNTSSAQSFVSFPSR